MKHTYELRKLEEDGKMETVYKITTNQENAEQEANAYVKRNQGLYTLVETKTIKVYRNKK